MGAIIFKNSVITFKSGTLTLKTNKVTNPTIGTISYSSGQIKYNVTNNDANEIEVYGNVQNTTLIFLGVLAGGYTAQYGQSFLTPPSGTVLTIRVQGRALSRQDSDVVSKEYTFP